MSDEMDRRDYLRLGTTAGVTLLFGGAGAKVGWDWYKEQDNRINPGELEQTIEKKNVNGVGYWGGVRDTAMEPDSITATIESTGETTVEGGREFTAQIESERKGGFDAIGDFLYYARDTGDEQTLADALFESHEVLFDFLYDTTGNLRETDRAPQEDRITTYTTVLSDPTAETRVSFDAETAEQIAKGGFLQPDRDFNPANNAAERERYRDVYDDNFTLSIHSADQIDATDAERTVEKRLQAKPQEAYDHVTVGGIEVTITPQEDDDSATYTAAVSAPVGSWSNIDICAYVEDGLETELASELAPDMETLFTGMYDELSQFATPFRGPDDEDIGTYELVALHNDAAARTSLDADDAAWIARGGGKPSTYTPENDEEHARFRQAYFDTFEASCDDR